MYWLNDNVHIFAYMQIGCDCRWSGAPFGMVGRLWAFAEVKYDRSDELEREPIRRPLAIGGGGT